MKNRSGLALSARKTIDTSYYYEAFQNISSMSSDINSTAVLHSDADHTDSNEFGSFGFFYLDNFSRLRQLDDGSDQKYRSNVAHPNTLPNDEED